MAHIFELDSEQLKGWEAWIATRPPVIQEMARRWPPNVLYRLDQHRVSVISYNEAGTVTVEVSGKYNRVLFGRNVFGVDPQKLIECELPPKDEDVGDTAREAGYSEKDIQEILIPDLKRRGKL